MISYQWFLSPDQPFDKNTLFKLQCCLCASGIYLDLSWTDGSPVLTISVPEQQESENRPGLPLGKDVPAVSSDLRDAALESSAPNVCITGRGRPSAKPVNDFTFGRVQHMRFMGVSAAAIAEEIGVSRRTFYRRWTQAQKLDLDPETPFSQWMCS